MEARQAKIAAYRVVSDISLPVVGSSVAIEAKGLVVIAKDGQVWAPDNRPGFKKDADLGHVLIVPGPEFLEINCPRHFELLT